MEEAYTEICQLFKTFIMKPYFGVECVYEDADTEQVAMPAVEDNLEIVDTGYEHNLNAQRARYQVGASVNRKETDKAEIEVNEELGLACEKMPKGLTLD